MQSNLAVCYVKAHFTKPGLSDHARMKIKVHGSVESQFSAFRFLNLSADHPQFNHIIQNESRLYIRRCAMYRVMQRLNGIKKKFKRLHSAYFASVEQKIEATNERLKDYQQQIQLNPLDHNLLHDEKIISNQVMKLRIVEEAILL